MRPGGVPAAAALALWTAVASANSTLVWKRTWTSPGNRDDVAEAVAVDAVGNAWVAGWSTRVDLGAGVDILVQKYSPDGALLWTRTHNAYPDAMDAAFGVAVDAAGCGYVAGTVSVTGGLSNAWLRKFAPDGSDLWTAEYDSPAGDQEVFRGVAVDPVTGTVYAAGCERRPDLFQEGNALLASFSAGTGSLLWATSFDGGVSLWDEALGVAVAPGGDPVVTGYVTRADPAFRLGGSPFARLEVLIDKTDGSVNTGVVTRRYAPTGLPVWERTFDADFDSTARQDWGRGVAVDATGVYTAATIERPAPDTFNRWVRKYTPDGLVAAWTRELGGAMNDDIRVAATPALTGSGRLLVAGWTSYADEDRALDMTVEHLDTAGGLEVRFDAHGSGLLLNDRAAAAAALPGGGFVVVGWENRSDLGQRKNLVILRFADPVETAVAPGVPTAWPNPYDPATASGGTLKFGGLPAGARVRLWTPAGGLVRELAVTGATATWDGLTGDGRPARPGLYWYLIEADGVASVKGTIVLVRRR